MLLRHDDDHPALVDAATGVAHNYAELQAMVDSASHHLGNARGLVALFADNSIRTVVWYLAALKRGKAVALLDPMVRPDYSGRLVETYRPELVIQPPWLNLTTPVSYVTVAEGVSRSTGPLTLVHTDLAILLTTSGSTGSPKLVRLSRRNVLSNARAIISTLGISRGDRAATTLPMHYSYGMSVINSHLLAGASVVVANTDLLDAAFWGAVDEYQVTSLAGVPFTYQTLRRIGFESMKLPTLKVLTQAGGKLDEPTVRWVGDLMSSRGGRFYVMYGQTEAGPRMACLPPCRLADKAGSVGVALPGGRFFIKADDGEPAPPNAAGTVFYEGPNVMMGYAQSRDDLALGDVYGDTLDTGDVGYLDNDGYLYLTGRTKRIAKVSGVRLSLDEIEQLLCQHGPVGVTERVPGQLAIYCAWGDEATFGAVRRQLCKDLRLPPAALTFIRLDALPMLANGKTNYRALEDELATGAGIHS